MTHKAGFVRLDCLTLLSVRFLSDADIGWSQPARADELGAVREETSLKGFPEPVPLFYRVSSEALAARRVASSAASS